MHPPAAVSEWDFSAQGSIAREVFHVKEGVECCVVHVQTMLLYLVGTVDRLPPASPLLKGTRLPVDSILQGAGLMTGQKSATYLTSGTESSLSA